MLDRCGNPNNTKFAEYGGRGITVCKRWRDFVSFLADMGERPAGCSLDRINNDGNYEPGNCKWSTYREQANNRRRWGTGRRVGHARGAKLIAAQVAEIKRLMILGVSPREIAAQFDISEGMAQNIRCGRNWSHVEAAA